MLSVQHSSRCVMSKQGKTLDVKRKGLFLFEEYLIKPATKLASKALGTFEVKIFLYIGTVLK